MLIGRVETRKAQKNHKCRCCRKAIPKGEVYVTWNWMDSKQHIDTIKTHMECKEKMWKKTIQSKSFS